MVGRWRVKAVVATPRCPYMKPINEASMRPHGYHLMLFYVLLSVHTSMGVDPILF